MSDEWRTEPDDCSSLIGHRSSLTLYCRAMHRIALPLLLVILGACATTPVTPVTIPAPEPAPMTSAETVPPPEAAPTAEEATQFVSEAEARLAQINEDQQRAAWSPRARTSA
jgi:hypothetical protein